MENTSFDGFSAYPYAMTTQQLLVEFCTPVDWPPYLLDLNPLDFSDWHVLQAKVQVTPHANLDALYLSIDMEWDRLAVEYIHKICSSFRRLALRKLKFKL
jgi:hypothetical protein